MTNKIEPHEIINTNRISDKIDYNEYQHYIIKSGTGTGKTYSVIKHHFEGDLPILSIVSRVSLAKEHKRAFLQYQENEENHVDYEQDFIGYWDYKNDSMKQFEGNNIIITINLSY